MARMVTDPRSITSRKASGSLGVRIGKNNECVCVCVKREKAERERERERDCVRMLMLGKRINIPIEMEDVYANVRKYISQSKRRMMLMLGNTYSNRNRGYLEGLELLVGLARHFVGPQVAALPPLALRHRERWKRE